MVISSNNRLRREGCNYKNIISAFTPLGSEPKALVP